MTMSFKHGDQRNEVRIKLLILGMDGSTVKKMACLEEVIQTQKDTLSLKKFIEYSK